MEISAIGISRPAPGTAQFGERLADDDFNVPAGIPFSTVFSTSNQIAYADDRIYLYSGGTAYAINPSTGARVAATVT